MRDILPLSRSEIVDLIKQAKLEIKAELMHDEKGFAGSAELRLEAVRLATGGNPGSRLASAADIYKFLKGED